MRFARNCCLRFFPKKQIQNQSRNAKKQTSYPRFKKRRPQRKNRRSTSQQFAKSNQAAPHHSIITIVFYHIERILSTQLLFSPKSQEIQRPNPSFLHGSAAIKALFAHGRIFDFQLRKHTSPCSTTSIFMHIDAFFMQSNRTANRSYFLRFYPELSRESRRV